MEGIVVSKFISILKLWLPLAVAITLLCGMIYTAAQQVYRHSANDPQIQMAEDAVSQLVGGLQPSMLITGPPIDMAASLEPYLIIFNESGTPVVSSGELDGRIPVPPPGVFEYSRVNKEDRITWKPRSDVRHAVVIMHYNGSKSGFVLAGRSMREAETRIGDLGIGVLIGWIFTMFATLITITLIELLWVRDSRPTIS
jgi:hypothetical protein